MEPYKVYINHDPGMTLTFLRQGHLRSPKHLNGKNSDYRERLRDVTSQHPGHSHGYKSVMAALLKANKRHILSEQMHGNPTVNRDY